MPCGGRPLAWGWWNLALRPPRVCGHCCRLGYELIHGKQNFVIHREEGYEAIHRKQNYEVIHREEGYKVIDRKGDYEVIHNQEGYELIHRKKRVPPHPALLTITSVVGSRYGCIFYYIIRFVK